MTRTAQDGDVLSAKTVFLRAEGRADRIHAVYKVAQNVMEYASGIATRTRAMVEAAQSVNPDCRVVTTRKHFPGTKRLSLLAVEAGGGLVHRTGLSESILIFDQHRVFSTDFAERLQTLRRLDPERKVAVEVGDVDEGVRAADLGADILQCDKMSPAPRRLTPDSSSPPRAASMPRTRPTTRGRALTFSSRPGPISGVRTT